MYLLQSFQNIFDYLFSEAEDRYAISATFEGPFIHPRIVSLLNILFYTISPAFRVFILIYFVLKIIFAICLIRPIGMYIITV